MNGVFLVGFMGCGKTTVGKLLAERLGWSFVDSDDDIEAAAGIAIAEIFAVNGEPAFRDLEHRAILERVRQVREGARLVVALGGGAFAEERNREALRGAGITVWLDVELEALQRRVEPATHRPLARDPVRFAALYGSRRVDYQRSDFRIDAGGDDPSVTVESIVRLLL